MVYQSPLRLQLNEFPMTVLPFVLCLSLTVSIFIFVCNVCLNVNTFESWKVLYTGTMNPTLLVQIQKKLSTERSENIKWYQLHAPPFWWRLVKNISVCIIVITERPYRNCSTTIRFISASVQGPAVVHKHDYRT